MTTISNDELADLLGLDFNDEDPDGPAPVSDEAVEVTHRRLDDARASGAPFVFQIDRKSFRAYETAAGAAAGLARFVEAEREVFENVDGERPVRAFIDCDAKPDASDADLKRVADAFTKEAVALGVPNDKARPLTLMNDRPGKRSRHLLANGWGFTDWRGLKRFEDGVRRRVGAAGLPGGLTAVDGLAKRRFALRLPGVPKLDRDGRPIPDSILQPDADDWYDDARYVARQSVDAWLIQGAASLTIYAKPWDEPADVSRSDEDPASAGAGADLGQAQHNNNNRGLGPFPGVEAEGGREDPQTRRRGFVAEVLRLFPYLRLRAPEAWASRARDPAAAAAAAAGEVAVFERVRPHWCPVCARDHESDGAYVCEEVVNGELRAAWLRCQRADKHAGALHSARWVRDSDRAGELRPLDEFDGLGYGTGAGRTIRYINARYNCDGIAAGSTRDTALRSVWGTGKTVYDVREVIDTIDRVRAENRNAFIVHVTIRQSLTGATVGGFADVDERYRPTDYRKVKGQLDPVNNPKHRHVVFQSESTKRIPLECPAPDLLIVDEVEAYCQHVFGGDGALSADKAASVSSIRSMVGKAGRVILLDNDLTEAHVAAFESLRARRPGYEGFEVIVNEAKPWAGMGFDIIHGDGSHEAVRLAALTFLQREKAKRDAREPWNGCVVACHSLDEARAMFRMARRAIGEDPDEPPEGSLGSIYTSETDGHVKRRDFADAGASWDGRAFVIYTGTVSVGVSHDRPHMSHAFGLFGDGNATAEGSAQMLFRSRQLRSVLVGYKGGAETGLPHTSAELLRWLVQPYNRHNIPDGIRDDRNPLAGMLGETSSDPEALRCAVDNFEGRVFVAATLSRLRSRANWLERFTRTLANAGITPRVIEGIEDEAAFRTESISAAVADQFGKRKLDGKVVDPFRVAGASAWAGRAGLIAANATAAAQAYADRVADGKQDQPRTTTEAENAGDEGARLAAMLRVPVEDITPEWVGHYGRNRGAIAVRYDRLYRLTNKPEALDADKAGLRRLDRPVVATEREGCAHAVEALRALGLAPSSDHGATVSPATLAAAEPTARAIADVAQRLYGYRKSGRAIERAGDTMKPRTVLTLLNVAADYIGARVDPQYATATAMKNGRPTGYALRWAWAPPESVEGGPEVTHPAGDVARAAEKQFTLADVYE